jgi:hypothetical protein
MDNGFITLHRKFLQWEWFDDGEMVRFWIFLLLKANWQQKQWHGILIPRGSFVSSLSHLARDSHRSEQAIRTMCQRLKSTGELTSKSTNRYTIYTIVKYEEYQSEELRLTSKSTSQHTFKQHSNNIQTTTTKQGNNINKETINKNTDEFWSGYLGRNGMKGSKKKAFEEWNKLTDEEKIIALSAIQKQKQFYEKCKASGVFVAELPDAWRWLRDRRFLDDIGDMVQEKTTKKNPVQNRISLEDA